MDGSLHLAHFRVAQLCHATIQGGQQDRGYGVEVNRARMGHPVTLVEENLRVESPNPARDRRYRDAITNTSTSIP